MALSKQRVRMPEHLLIKEVSSSSSCQDDLEHVWAYLQAAVTIHLGWQYLHLLEEQHSAGQGEHLRGQGALTGTEESSHPLP